MSKKILFVANVCKEHILKFHVPTIKKMKDEGWIVDVACSGEEKVPYCDNQFNMSWTRSPFSLKLLKGINELKNIVNQNDYDIVYCHTPVGGIAGRIASVKARKKGTRVIYFAHGYHFFKGAPILNWILFYPIEKVLSYITDGIFVINNEDFQLTKNHFNKKLYLKKFPGIGIDFNRIKVSDSTKTRVEYRKQLGVGENEILLIYVAEVIKNKNQGYLLEALKEILKIQKSVKLLLVGPDHSNGIYLKEAKKLGISDKVIFTGWRNDVGELLCASDICVASSIREGFGINLVEAMYQNLPVVAVKNRGHLSCVVDGENGFLVSLDNPQEMAKRVKEIIENVHLYKKLINYDVTRFRADSIAENIVNTIKTNF